MTTVQVKLNLPDRLAREARDARLLMPQSFTRMLKDTMRRRAGQALLAGAARATAAGSKPMSMDAIQAEVNAVRTARNSRKTRSRA